MWGSAKSRSRFHPQIQIFLYKIVCPGRTPEKNTVDVGRTTLYTSQELGVPVPVPIWLMEKCPVIIIYYPPGSPAGGGNAGGGKGGASGSAPPTNVSS